MNGSISVYKCLWLYNAWSTDINDDIWEVPFDPQKYGITTDFISQREYFEFTDAEEANKPEIITGKLITFHDFSNEKGDVIIRITGETYEKLTQKPRNMNNTPNLDVLIEKLEKYFGYQEMQMNYSPRAYAMIELIEKLRENNFDDYANKLLSYWYGAEAYEKGLISCLIRR